MIGGKKLTPDVDMSVLTPDFDTASLNVTASAKENFQWVSTEMFKCTCCYPLSAIFAMVNTITSPVQWKAIASWQEQ